MSAFKPIMEIGADEWLRAMKLPQSDIPDAIIVEGSWWRAQRTQWRTGYLDEVRELAFPDIFWGTWRGKKVGYCCAYGAPRTSEIIHIFATLGTRLAIQIGTCGGLQPHLKPGDVILPELAIGLDGVAHLYGAGEAAGASEEWIDRAHRSLRERSHTAYRGKHVTWSSLFTETAELIATWRRAGYLSVDMETATTYAVAQHFGREAVSLLVVWDDLTRGKHFLDPLSYDEQRALEQGNAAVYETALALVEAV